MFILLLLLLPLSSNASYCKAPPVTWMQTETTIEIEEKKYNQLYSSLIDSMINFGEKPDSEIIMELNALKLINRQDWQVLKLKYRKGDRLFELIAPPLSGPILICLMRKDDFIKEIFIAIQ